MIRYAYTGLLLVMLSTVCIAVRCGQCVCVRHRIICRSTLPNFHLVPNRDNITLLDMRGVEGPFNLGNLQNIFPSLEKVDLRGSGCIADIDNLTSITVLSDCESSTHSSEMTSKPQVFNTNKKRPMPRILPHTTESSTTNTIENSIATTSGSVNTPSPIQFSFLNLIIFSTITAIISLVITIMFCCCWHFSCCQRLETTSNCHKIIPKRKHEHRTWSVPEYMVPSNVETLSAESVELYNKND